jgi:hypothetical protein
MRDNEEIDKRLAEIRDQLKLRNQLLTAGPVIIAFIFMVFLIIQVIKQLETYP